MGKSTRELYSRDQTGNYCKGCDKVGQKDVIAVTWQCECLIILMLFGVTFFRLSYNHRNFVVTVMIITVNDIMCLAK